VGLGVAALGSAAIACLPKVPATLVIDDAPPRPKPTRGDASASKPADGRDRRPPEIVRAELSSATSLRIHFSEAVEPLDAVDPKDFRISVLRRYANRRAGYFYAYYYDPGYMFHGVPLTLTRARGRTTELDIEFTPEFGQDVCRNLDYGYDRYGYTPPGVETDAGLFLHYAAGKIPIRDADGNPLANFGVAWVEAGRRQPPESRMHFSGAEAGRVGVEFVRVECGPPIPAGPR
jgi:hypothetical protein